MAALGVKGRGRAHMRVCARWPVVTFLGLSLVVDPPLHPPMSSAGEDAGVSLRGLFIISPSGVLRQKTVNDLPVGRSGARVRGWGLPDPPPRSCSRMYAGNGAPQPNPPTHPRTHAPHPPTTNPTPPHWQWTRRCACSRPFSTLTSMARCAPLGGPRGPTPSRPTLRPRSNTLASSRGRWSAPAGPAARPHARPPEQPRAQQQQQQHCYLLAYPLHT